MPEGLKPTKKGILLYPNRGAADALYEACLALLEEGEGEAVLEDITSSEDPIVVSLSEWRGERRLDIRHWYLT